MKKTLSVLAFVSGVLFLVSCGSPTESGKQDEIVTAPPPGPQNPGDDNDISLLTFNGNEAAQILSEYDEKILPKMNLTLDGTLPEQHGLLLRQDLLSINSLSFDETKLKNLDAEYGNVSDVFGDSSRGGLLSYLNQRMKVVVGSNAEGFTRQESIANISEKRRNAFMTAQNFGTLMWYTRMLSNQRVYVQGQSSVFEVKSMRDGIVMLLDGYLTTAKPEGSPDFVRISSPGTLIHEARHSDCSVAMTRGDFDRIRATKNQDLTAGNLKCGHLHVNCPVGHKLQGLAACDSEYWGAYTMSALFSLFVEKACTNCSEIEKSLAKGARLDSFSRVVPFTENPEATLPNPDLSHLEPK
jgi:hypothetical protein